MATNSPTQNKLIENEKSFTLIDNTTAHDSVCAGDYKWRGEG